VPPRDTFALADAITGLVRNADMRAALAAGGRKRAEEFSWPRVTQKVLSYYERLRYARGAMPPSGPREPALWRA
jgi:glycosyltransferase involved in cell wall biosynthesis